MSLLANSVQKPDVNRAQCEATAIVLSLGDIGTLRASRELINVLVGACAKQCELTFNLLAFGDLKGRRGSQARTRSASFALGTPGREVLF